MNNNDRIQQNVQVALGYSVPPVLPIKWQSFVKGVDKTGIERSELKFGDTRWACPTSLALSSDPTNLFRLPLDPVISIDSDTEVVKREIAKSDIRGTVKELWNKGDWNINISGLLQKDSDNEKETLNYYTTQLLNLINSGEALVINNDQLNNTFGVTKIVIESYSFPFTKGLDYQQFQLNCVSDESYDLYIED